MDRMKKTLKDQSGFTLIEMLIVVAIIAILIAISIPVVNSSLEKARQATDDANLRAAKAAAIIDYLDDNSLTGNYYDLKTGQISATRPTKQGQTSANKDSHIKVTIDSNNNVKAEWEPDSTPTT